MSHLPLDGRVAIVSGANHGIGAATAAELAGWAPTSPSPTSRTPPRTTIPAAPRSTAPSGSGAPKQLSPPWKRLAGGSTPSRPT